MLSPWKLCSFHSIKKLRQKGRNYSIHHRNETQSIFGFIPQYISFGSYIYWRCFSCCFTHSIRQDNVYYFIVLLSEIFSSSVLSVLVPYLLSVHPMISHSRITKHQFTFTCTWTSEYLEKSVLTLISATQKWVQFLIYKMRSLFC